MKQNIFDDNKKIHIVGSSRKLLTQNLGTVIDTADYVIRFNRSPVIGYERYVGTKTTHRFVNRPVAKNEFDAYQEKDYSFLKKLKNQLIILDQPGWDNTPTMTDEKFYSIFDRTCKYVYLNRSNEVLILYNNFKDYFIQHDIVEQKTRPSIGFAMICYCLNRNLNVTISGFGIDEHDHTASHYYDTKPAGFKVGHDYGFERKILKLLLT